MSFSRGVLRPEAYHGHSASPPYFEAWYVKLVTADGSRSLALIPGVFRGREASSAHAFLQVVGANGGAVRYVRGPADRFVGEADRFDVRFEAGGGSHRFSAGGLEVNLEQCRGRIEYGPLDPWPVTPLSPGAMGPFAWVPRMECRHGVCSLGHRLAGQLELDGRMVDFTGGRGYIEKDWGRSFPRHWLWTQCEHFEREEACVSASVATVPWLGLGFPGFLVALRRGDALYRFATYTGARLERLERLPRGVRLQLANRRHRLVIETSGGHPIDVHVPSEADMKGVVTEHLDASMQYKLLLRSDDTVLAEDRGRQAAWELQGEPDDISG